ncbi:MAG: CPBP family intramembrane metalloprotease [Actinobacteria bacterium]|nr:MAG: CPBP family intramembrane metalloprotease [Actinomycetota bacterium]
MELVIVLSLSLLPSAVDSLISLLTAPLAGVSAFVYANVQFIEQLTGILFALAPIALVLYLARRNGEGLQPFGLGTGTLAQDVPLGLLGAVAVCAVGAVVYLAAVSLKINRFVVPVPPLGHWWTIPILVLGAIQAGALEEVVVAAYLIRRLRQLRWSGPAAVLASATLRGSYHLYQGWGGFAGNFLLGVAFGTYFVRRGRAWPLIVAHATVDIVSGLAYIAFRNHCYFGACIR